MRILSCMKTGQRNNKGFSLVELVIVIAIMAVLTGLISLGVGSITGSKVTKCAQNMESVIEKVRVSSMGKSAVVLTISKGADGAYYAKQETVSKKTTTVDGGSDDTVSSSIEERIGDSSVNVAVAMSSDADGTYTQLADNNKIVLQFDRASGALKTDANGKYVKCIYIYNARQTRVKKILLYQETGNIELTTPNSFN